MGGEYKKINVRNFKEKNRRVWLNELRRIILIGQLFKIAGFAIIEGTINL
jgi:hypothetical protein